MKPDNGILGRAARLAAGLEDGLLVLLLALMIGLTGTQILLRNVWGTGLPWADPLVRVLVLWLTLVGAMVATREDNHININILSRYLPKPGQFFAHLITDLFTAVVCAVVAYHGYRFVLMEKEDGATAFAGVPAWACELIIPFGFSVIALRLLLSFLIRIRRGSATP